MVPIASKYCHPNFQVLARMHLPDEHCGQHENYLRGKACPVLAGDEL